LYVLEIRSDLIQSHKTYEALTPLWLNVSRCPTHVGVRHSYDTCTTLVQTCQRGVQKINFFFIPTLLKSVSDTYKTLVQTCEGKCPNFIFFICFYFFQTYIQRLKMCQNNNIDQWEIKDITFWLHYF
jgi:hypothetical protein